jgi:hypothetical protein
MAAPQAAKPIIAPPKLAVRVVKGKREHALWTHLYGVEGIGKSTFLAGAPKPIVIDVEKGTEEIDLARFVFDDDGRTQPKDWEEMKAAVRALEQSEHNYETVGIDTLDAIEALIWQHICRRDNQANIHGYGFNKGFDVAVDEWRILVAMLERIRARGIHVVTLGHSIIKAFKDPLSEGWDRYIMKLHDKAAGLIRERADVVLFTNYETSTEIDGRSKRVRAEFGTRLIYTEKTSGFDAKNRHDLPPVLPLSWTDYWSAVKAHKPADPKALAERIRALAEKADPEAKAKALAFVEQYQDNAAALAKALNRMQALVPSAEGN